MAYLVPKRLAPRLNIPKLVGNPGVGVGMTLRLDPAIDELVADAAHDKGVTKSAWIRSAIRQRLKSQRELQDPRTKAASQG